MDVVAFVIEEKISRKGNKFYVLSAQTKDGSKYFINFVRKQK